MEKIIKQYGLERSGTNYIKSLVELNSDSIVLSMLYGGKHFRYEPVTKDFNPFENKFVVTDLDCEKILKIKYEFLRDNVFYLISIKNPFSWVVSYREYCQRHEYDVDLSADTLIRIWNEYNLSWVGDLSGKKNYVVSYDKLIKHPFKELKNIFRKFSIPIPEEFTDISNNMNEGGDLHGVKNVSNYAFNKRKYYRLSKYLLKLSDSDIEVIEKNADTDLLRLL